MTWECVMIHILWFPLIELGTADGSPAVRALTSPPGDSNVCSSLINSIPGLTYLLSYAWDKKVLQWPKTHTPFYVYVFIHYI